jgi:hypothetical protein
MSNEPVAAAIEAVFACERLAVQLAELAAWLDHTAAVVRADWVGPHRDTFDRRVAGIRSALLESADTLNVLRVRVDTSRGQK